MEDKYAFHGDPVEYWMKRVDRAEQYLEYTEEQLIKAIAQRAIKESSGEE